MSVFEVTATCPCFPQELHIAALSSTLASELQDMRQLLVSESDVLGRCRAVFTRLVPDVDYALG